LKAAANPARKDYLFYVRKPGKSGEHAFSSTDAQFQRDVKRYQDSREK
jgi:cell division protein YceG involved in septum cleavage